MQAEMKPFREGGSLPSGLAWNAKDEAWLCGDDFGTVMIYSEEKDSFEGFNACDSTINAIAINNSGNICALGFNDALNLREYPKVNSVVKDTLLRKELPPTCIQYDSTGSLVFVSSMQEDISIHSLEGSSTSQSKINTNGKAIRTFALSPSNSFIGLVDVEGTVKIFSLSISNKTLQSVDLCSESFELVSKKVSQFGGMGIDFGCKLSWYPDESHRVMLAAPSMEGSVVFMSREGENSSWTESILTCDSEGQPGLAFGKGLPLSAVCFSPSGSHLAACDTEGSVLLWSTNATTPADSTPLRKITAGVPLVDLVWNQRQKSSNNYLLLVGKDSFVRVDNAVPRGTTTPDSEGVVTVTSSSPSSMPPSALARKRLTKPGAKVEFRLDNNSSSEAPSASAAADDDDDNLFDEEEKTFTSTTTPSSSSASTAEEVDAISIRQIKQSAFRSRVVEDETDRQPAAEEEGTEYDDDDDAVAMDESNGAAEGLSAEELLRLASLTGAAAAASMPLQEAFQPACTRADEKQRRYLVWNSFGNITSREESVENRVEIRFSNTLGNNKNEAFADRDGFSMASLSLEGAIFATEKETDDEEANLNKRSEFKKALPGSTLFYHAFPGQKQLEGVNESFRVTLPDGEGVLAVAVGRGWCAVATDARLLRVFSSTGLQVKILTLAGPAVTLCGFESSLAVVYHAGTPLDEHYQQKVDLYEVNWREGCSMRAMVTGLSVPLTRKARLSWIGFEVDLSLLVLCDSNGVFHTLSRAFTSQWEWLSVLDVERVKKSIDHAYWPVMVKNGKLAFVLLNGESRPAVYPQPVTHSRLFSMPVVTPAHVKEGSAECLALKERLSILMWEEVKTRHCEAMKDDIGRNGLFAVGFDNQEAIERMLSKQELEADKLVLKMLQDACKVNQIPQALNLALKLRTEVAISGAIKVANNLGRVSVAAALDAMLRHKQMLNSIIMEQQVMQQQQQQQQHQSYSEEVEIVTPPAASIFVEEKKNQLSARLPPSGRPLKPPAAAVSPEAVAPNPSATAVTKERGVMNPFAVSGNTPVKRKSAFEGVVDLQKESPSPKKTMLNRQSSFSNVARAAKNGDKTFL